jgi:probable F420-dependent oxidoreductase
VKVGVQLPEIERVYRWPEIRDIAVTAEAVGFDSIWLGDHLLFDDPVSGRRGPLEAWSLLAALGEATSRVQLGPLVAATSFHSPAMLAKKAATVDDISGGRLVLGLGAGWNRPEYGGFGFAFDNRVARFEEAFGIIRRLLAGETVDFSGRYYSVSSSELLPPPTRRIPLMIGSNGPRMLRIAAPHVDMWNSWFTGFGNQPEGLAPLIAEVESACRDTGRDPAEVEKTAAVYVQLARGSGRVAGSAERPHVAPITGEAAAIAHSLLAFAEVGVTTIQVVLDPIDASAVEELGKIVAMMRDGSAG